MAPFRPDRSARYPFSMPAARESDDSGGVPPKLSLSQRLLLALPRLRRDADRPPLTSRLRDAMVKPVDPSTAKTAKADERPMTVDELQAAVDSADDKERLVGLLLAPVAAAIALIVTSVLVSDDPAVLLKSGAVNKLHVNPSIYYELELVLLALAVLMLVMAWRRKRLFLGIAMALYGLAIFNLHYWGFGIPYILAGAWLLVRAYRLQRDLKEATGGGPARPGTQGRGGQGGRNQPNKRYTPPGAAKKPPPKRNDEKRAG
jgi:hypothetical protein